MSMHALMPRAIVLEGSPAEMGLRHGQLLKDEIRLLLEQVCCLIFRRVGPIRGPGVQVLAHGFGLAMNRHIPERLREEIRGIALGSGLRYLDVLLLNTLDDVLNILRRLAPRSPQLGCSSFALFGKRTRDGALLHGRNLDYHFRNTPLDDGGKVSRLLQSNAILFVVRPRGRAAFLSIAWPGMAGTSTAMNEVGLSLGNLTSYVRGTSPNGVPATLVYRSMIEEATTLAEAGQRLRGFPRTIGNNLLVGSGWENSAALFEITRDRVVERPPVNDAVVATNHFASPDLARRQRPFLPRHSVVRCERLRALCDRQGLAPYDALRILADAGEKGDGRDADPFARIANEGTAVSVLFKPAAMELWMGLAEEPPASGGKFFHMEAGKLLALPLVFAPTASTSRSRTARRV